MKFMYHRQAVGFMRDNAKIPLLPLTAEIYLSYISSKCVSSTTKKEILWHLRMRAAEKAEALVVHSHMFHHLLELEDRMDISYCLFNLCARLAQHDDIAAEICDSLIASVRPASLLRDTHDHDLFWEALGEITHTYLSGPVAASAAVDAHILDDIVEVLKASTITNQKHLPDACWTSANLAWHKSTAVAVVRANVPHYAMELLKSPFAPLIQAYLLRILAYLVLHESTVAAVLSMRPCEQLVRLLRVSIRDADVYTTECVFNTFTLMSRNSDGADGAKVVVAASILDCIPEGIASRSALTQYYACELLCELVRHPTMIPAVLRSVPRDAVVGLLSHKSANVRRWAPGTLHRIDEGLKNKDEA
ncbi:hypothetical protein C8J57DRAFT_1337543 [Mycena rebaudengoi]|nr:hypothetical protein C8J57DRAFT_1337543 [Mycena rebaudengoi]